VSLSSVASAQEIDDASRTAARAMGNSGVEAYQAGNYQEAVDRLEKAYGIARVPSLGLWSARALRKLGLLVEAANRYLETVGLQIPEGDYVIQKQAQTDATRELKELRPRIPVLKIEVKGAKAAEAINGFCPLDLDTQAFPVGMCTRTVFGKAEIVLWRTAPETFRIEVWRSFASYVLGCLEEAGREYRT
jgi:hypothetical protein